MNAHNVARLNNVQLMSTAEVAELLGVDESRVRQLVAAHRLSAVKLTSRQYAFHRPVVERFLANWDRSPGRPAKRKR